jgi:hypothetical protein
MHRVGSIMQCRYNTEKHNQLVRERGMGFDEIIDEIENGNFIEAIDHGNQERYPGQKIMFVRCVDTVCMVPYVIEDDGTLFLKTLYPSRKATKIYLK